LGGLVLMLYFSRRLSGISSARVEDRLIRVLASGSVGMKKNISLVEVPGEILVVGIAGERINLLTSIKDPDIINSLKERSNGKYTTAFGQHLKYFTSKITGNQDAE
jgi:flagellar biogenesis protein FliO